MKSLLPAAWISSLLVAIPLSAPAQGEPQFEGLSGSEDLQKFFEKLMPIPEEMKEK